LSGVERDLYLAEDRIAAAHWWFVVRRRLFAREIGMAAPGRRGRVLDVGTGSGSNLPMLRDLGFAEVAGLDSSPIAVDLCARKGFSEVKCGDVCALPFPDRHFDIVLATDIIEHVADDGRALREIERVVAPGGAAIITVPAFQMLWGAHDSAAHHLRRYRLADLVRKTEMAGLEVERAYYFNFILFLPILAVRRLFRWLGLPLKNENELTGPWLNRVLQAVFGLDVFLARRLYPPFGVSALIVARKRRL
jgi:SAM-dependent methyltransferase